MLTYFMIKYTIEEDCDLDELILNLLLSVILIPFDLMLILFQPMFYLIYKKWSDESDW